LSESRALFCLLSWSTE